MYANRPVVKLRVDFEQCYYEVYVNGGLVAADRGGNAAHLDYPVNHWLRNGSNQILVYLHKPARKVDRCNAKVALKVTDFDDEKAPEATALTLAHSAEAAEAGTPFVGSSPSGLFHSRRRFEPSQHGDFRVLPATIVQLAGRGSEVHVLSRSFEAQLPFPEWAFFRGEKLPQWFEYPNDEALLPDYKRILGAYEQLWALLEKRDVNGFVDACEERSREIDIAFYKKAGETRQALRESLESDLHDPEYELARLDGPGYWWYAVGSTGKVLQLASGKRLSPILRLEMKDGTEFSLIYPVAFRKEGDRFIVTR